ncbi:putative E3 ubiquitin-protein ligase hulA [Grifola frondosa]|uniref:HECT-type E3 ubiquitin transferase n=1 Tax=Grifola frondosa TaxID=5627 RepID=A0A1C7LW91_GRIFR|nr:putative E3 ubiquitin-protein ligase hulA [Grifola frondosa]
MLGLVPTWICACAESAAGSLDRVHGSQCEGIPRGARPSELQSHGVLRGALAGFWLELWSSSCSGYVCVICIGGDAICRGSGVSIAYIRARHRRLRLEKWLPESTDPASLCRRAASQGVHVLCVAKRSGMAQVYYVDHNTRTTTWEDPRAPSELSQEDCEFQRKLRYFGDRLHDRAYGAVSTSTITSLSVRDNVFYEDAFRAISTLSPEAFMGVTTGDGSKDRADVTKQLVYSLFGKVLALDFDPMSGIDPERLGHLKFAGRCFALALFHCRSNPAKFMAAFCKRMLNKELALSDLEIADPALNDNVTNGLPRTFAMADDMRGARVTVEPKPAVGASPSQRTRASASAA